MIATVHSMIKGFLAWTLCSTSSNRSDDVRVLKLCELQPYILMHLNKYTQIPAILGLQAEDKAGHHGMKTVSMFESEFVNPTLIGANMAT